MTLYDRNGYIIIISISQDDLHIRSISLRSTFKRKVRKRSLVTGSDVDAKCVTSLWRYDADDTVTTSWNVLQETTLLFNWKKLNSYLL